MGRFLKFAYIILFFIIQSITVYAGENAGEIPYSVRMVLFKTQQLLAKDKTFEALELLEKFQSKQPPGLKPGGKNPKGYQHYYINFNIGNCYLKLDNIKKASAAYKAAVTNNPEFTPAWLNLAKCYYDMEDYNEAGNCFFKGYTTAEDKTPEVLYYSAVSFMAAGNNKKSLEVFENLFATYNEKIKLEWKQALAQLYLSTDQPLKALPYLEEIVAEISGKSRKEWQKILLYQYISLNMKSKSLNYATRLINEDPIEPEWWKILLHIHLTDDCYQDALSALTILSYIRTLTLQETKLLADLNMNLGIPVQAVNYYEKLISEKKDSKIYEKLISACLALHKPDKALKIIDHALQYKREKKICMLKGRILFEQEKYKEAYKLYQRVAKEMPHPGYPWLMAGYSAWYLEDITKAAYAFNSAARYPKYKKKAEKIISIIKDRGKFN
ncbi:MAG: tetratricopeptide repeat protein [Deltaproteobacteria bacterium]|nr:tetratricopeptide repeat protein [Deltaproteobacteria bacterium]